MSGVSGARAAFRGVREFLPNWKVTAVRPNPKVPFPKPNVAVFRVDIKMNKFEIGDYLRHIYGVDVTKVNTHIVSGKVKRHRYSRQRTIKRPDYKLAYVTLGEDDVYHFPDMFPKEEASDESK